MVSHAQAAGRVRAALMAAVFVLPLCMVLHWAIMSQHITARASVRL